MHMEEVMVVVGMVMMGVVHGSTFTKMTVVM